MSSFPAAAGSAILTGLGRSAWWLVKKYAATPVTSTALAAFTIGMGMAASNALFGQTEHHPAPLFFDGPVVTQQASVQAPAPVAPVEIAPAPVRPVVTQQVVQTPVTQTQPVAEVPVAATGEEVTNAELAEAQRKLQAMGLFTGDVDGYYGPKTAEAIRAFEMRNGLTPKGDMSRPVIEAILRAQASDHASIDAARTTARAAETTTPAAQPLANITPETPADVPGQQALAALITPSEPVVASVSEPQPTVTPEPEVAVTQVASTPVVQQTPNPAADADLIENIQKGLASLGFLHGRIDGVIGEETARAIRNFEVFNNYEVTGRVSPELVDLLVAAGAEI